MSTDPWCVGVPRAIGELSVRILRLCGFLGSLTKRLGVRFFLEGLTTYKS